MILFTDLENHNTKGTIFIVDGGFILSIMAIDYGDAHTGIAISDPTLFLTGFSTTIHLRKANLVADEIAQLITTHQVEQIVLGFPKNMDGSESKRAALYRSFGTLLEEKTGLSPIFWDERRSSVEAHNILASSGKNAKKRKKTVDAVAAGLILEGYLTFLKNQS